MIWKKVLDNPILAIGILFFAIFLFTLRDQGFFGRYEKLKATSCRSVLVMLQKRMPKNWGAKCIGNNLNVEIAAELVEKNYKTPLDFKKAHYRDLANHLTFIAKNSLNESLERVFIVNVIYESDKLKIVAITEGKFISKMATMTSPEFLADHLKRTVKIKEVAK